MAHQTNPKKKTPPADPASLPFRRERILTVGWLAFLAPIPLAFSFALEPLALAVYLSLLGALLYRVRQGRIPTLSSVWLNLAGFSYFFLFYADVRFGSRSLLRAALHLLLFTTLFKLASIRREKDFSWALVLMGSLFLGSMATAVHVSILLFVALFAAVAWPSLVRWALWRDLAAAPDEWRRDPDAKDLPGRAPTAVSVAAVLVLGVPFFVTLPRLKTPYVTGFEQGREVSTGFSETVDPDSYGRLKQDNRVFMRLSLGRTVSANEANRLYIRALAFGRYEGRTWKKTESDGQVLLRDEESWYKVGSATGRAARPMTIDLSPLGSRYVPVPVDAVAVRFPEGTYRGSRPWSLRRDALSNFKLPVEPDKLITYEVMSTGLPTPDLSGPGLVDPEKKALGSKRIRDFVADVTKGLDPETEPERVAARLAGYLATRYTYTLDIARAGANPVEEFLFERKAGQCETFASGMAMALREVGIPTRFVTGFAGGEIGLFGRYIVVRGRDSHAWVEAWCGPKAGWLLFDPTPEGGRPLLSEVGWSGAFRQVTDGVSYFYDRFILSFQQGDQIELIRTLRDAAVAAWTTVSSAATGLVSFFTRTSGLIVLGLAVPVLVFVVRRLRLRLPRLRLFPSAPPPASAAYRRLQKALRRAGATITPASAPADVFEAARGFGEGATTPAREIIRSYVAESFGGQVVDGVEARRLKLLLARLDGALKS